MIKVFWLTGTRIERHWLRRYSRLAPKNGGSACQGRIAAGYNADYAHHDAQVLLGSQLQRDPAWEGFGTDDTPHEDPRWPACCACGYEFLPDDYWQHRGERLYRGAPDGQLYQLRDVPVGSMWDAHWYGEHTSWACGPDGICLMVRTPGGDWHVDGPASNCTRPDDRVHKCWVRHGDPRTGQIHVDKNGDTCAAGAGSIIAGSYHGFLDRGHLTAC